MASRDDDPAALRADCRRCAALCCVAPAFAASAEFAIAKDAGVPCPHLGADFRCTVHDRLRPEGFSGCAAYDCFGAGQRVTEVAFAGRDWRTTPAIAPAMFRAFAVVRALHELLWHLNEALALDAARPLVGELRQMRATFSALAAGAADALAAIDVAARHADANAVLVRASELARAAAGATTMPGRELRGADLVGKDLHGGDLRAANLRGARLVAADLRHADLRDADLAGADLRGADLGGANLTGALFVTQAQIDAASGDHQTRLPRGRTRPAHWPRVSDR